MAHLSSSSPDSDGVPRSHSSSLSPGSLSANPIFAKRNFLVGLQQFGRFGSLLEDATQNDPGVVEILQV
jgi:hypothetical protein